MRKVNWKTWVFLCGAIICAALAFWRCYSGRFSEVTPVMLINSGLTAPYAGEQDLLSVTSCCLRHSASWLEQVCFYAMHQEAAFPNSQGVYVVYAVGAALACFFAFKVGAACVSPFVGLAAAFFLAMMPLSHWANCAFTAALILFNFDRLLTALKFNTYLSWVVYSLSCLLMFFNCFFTEAVVLQWWFGAQFAALLIRMALISVHHKSPYYRTGDILPRVLVRGEANLKDVYLFLGVSAVSWAVLSVLLACLMSVSMGGNLYMMDFFKMLLASFMLIAIGAICFLMLPRSDELRKNLLKFFGRFAERAMSQVPEKTFFVIRQQQLGLALCFFALSVLTFTPFVLKIYNVRMRYTIAGGLAAFWDFAKFQDGPWTALAPLMPLLCVALAFLLRKFRKINSQELCGVVTMAIFSCIFLFQQRYAAISAPFFVISAFTLPYLCLRALSSSKEPAKEVANA